MIYPTQRFRLMVLAISVSGFFGFSAVGPSDRFAHAAEVKTGVASGVGESSWRPQRKKARSRSTSAATRRCCRIFEKEYPEIKADFGDRPRLPDRAAIDGRATRAKNILPMLSIPAA